MNSTRGLQAALGTIGTVATVAGTSAVVQGTANVVRGGDVSENVDSEFRFYASWYAVFGALLLTAARRPETGTTVVRAAGAGFCLAGVGRVLSWRARGRPHGLFVALTVAEFAIPIAIIPWQRRVRYAPAATRT
jgi:hypothetical protein